jgi:hypothetical protein
MPDSDSLWLLWSRSRIFKSPCRNCRLPEHISEHQAAKDVVCLGGAALGYDKETYLHYHRRLTVRPLNFPYTFCDSVFIQWRKVCVRRVLSGYPLPLLLTILIGLPCPLFITLVPSFYTQSFSTSPLNLLPNLVLCPFHSSTTSFPTLLPFSLQSPSRSSSAAAIFASLIFFSNTAICCL